MLDAARNLTLFQSAALSSTSNLHSVHTTLSNAGTGASPAVIVSWASGLPTIGPVATVWPSATPPATSATSGAFPGSGPAGTVYLSTTAQGNGAPVAAYTRSVQASPIQYLKNYTCVRGESGGPVRVACCSSSLPVLRRRTTADVFDNSGNKNWGVPANMCVLFALANKGDKGDPGECAEMRSLSPHTPARCYLSANLYHTTVTGLAPGTTYFFVVGSPSSGYSQEASFTTPPAPNSASVYPYTLGLIADIGQTQNTSKGMGYLAALRPQVVLNVRVADRAPGRKKRSAAHDPGSYPHFCRARRLAT